MAIKISKIKIGDNLHEINSNYWGDYSIESLKTINGESILEEGGGDINPQFIEIEYSDLLSYRDNNKLIPGRHYRITDYNTKTTQSNTESANHQFDIIVTADGTNSLSEVARSCFHDGDNYFSGVNLGAWELRYCLDNNINRFTWADPESGKGVIYYMKDEFGNEAPYDFKNIKFIYNSDFLTENANWKSAVLGQYTGTQLSFYTFSYYNTQSGVVDDSLKVQSNHYAHGNKINNYFRNEDGKLTLNNIVFVATENSPYNNIIEKGCHDCIFGDNCYGNTIGFDSSSNVVGNSFYNNKIGSEFKRNKIYNTGSNPKFHSNILGNYCEDNFFPKQFVSCECGDNFTDNDFFTNTSNPNLSSVTNCIFGNNFKNNTGMNTTLSNIEILNNTLSGKGNWNDIIVDNGKTINKCLSDYKGLGYFKLFIGLDENNRVFLRDFNEQCVYHMGNFENISSALQHASNVEIAGNISLSKISFTTGTIDNSLDATNVGLHTGYIEQYISGNVSTQVIIWQSGFRMRKITFTDNNRTTIDDNKTTDSIKKGEGAGVYWSNPTSLYYDQTSHKIALNRFDDGQKWGLSGCFGEVEIPLVSNSIAGLMSVGDKSLLTNTSALLNKFVKSKVYNSLPDYVGGDWYSHKRYWYRFAKINDKSPNIFRISTNAANDVIFTSSIGWSNGSSYDVTGALSVINSSLNSNENHACIEGIRLVASSSGGYIDMLLNTPYSNSNGYVEIYVTCISTIFNNNDYEPLYNNIEKLEEKGATFERNGETIVQSFDLVDKAIMSKDFILTNESGEQISVADSIVNKLSPIQNILYSDLKDLRDNNNLIPGQKYRITDYVTTTSQENTQSAGHQFDIIVEALNENTLSEDAKAIQNENDGYFDEANLEAWELKYCLDNDKNRFSWGTNTVVNSENVNIIDTLITDNEFNEPFLSDYYIYVDTAGNNVNRYTLGDEMRDNDFFIEYGRETSPDGMENQLCIYKNDLSDENYIEGGAEEGVDYADKFFYWGTEEVDGIIYDKWKKSEVDSGWNITEDGGNVFILTQRITTGEVIEDNYGKGVIYYMKDEWNNEAPYDFKNIKFYREEQDNYVFTFSWINENNEVEDLTLRQDLLSDEGIVYGTHDNIIKSYYQEDDFKPYLVLNDIVFINTYDYDGGFFYGCNNNTFGNNCYSNTFGNYCYSNIFGNECYSNTFGDDCNNNTFGDDCNNNTFGNYCYSNIFGNECYSNTFGDDCNNNTFGNECYSNIFGIHCCNNTFGNECNNNTFGDDCYSNTFGEICRWIAFYDDTEYNYKNGKYTYGGEKLNYISNISLGNRCSHLLFYPNSNLGTIGNDNMINNITVTKGIKGEQSSNSLLTLEIPVTNNEYELKIACNSNGDIKMYCEADLIQ